MFVCCQDGRFVAYVSESSGSGEVYVMAIETLESLRLTYEGADNTVVVSWGRDQNIIYCSDVRGIYSQEEELFSV